MKTRKLIQALALSALTVAAASSAEAVSYTVTKVLTVNGQLLNFDFLGVPASDGNGGWLTVASGVSNRPGTFRDGLDLNPSSSQRHEYFDLSIEGTDKGRWACNARGSISAIPGASGGDDCDFALHVGIGGSELDAYLADSNVGVIVDFGRDVGHFHEEDQVIVTLKYDVPDMNPVPVPAALPLAASAFGLMGFMGWRRKKA